MSEERDVFFKCLVDMLKQNPDSGIRDDSIYSFLCFYNTYNNRINMESLVSVQARLKNRFSNNSWSHIHFLVVENRNGMNDQEYYEAIDNSIKIYVPVDAKNIYAVSKALFNYCLKENMVMQCKVADKMRRDALVLRIYDKNDVKKVREYLEKLDYQTNIRHNPFILKVGKASMTVDGILSYNTVLSQLICHYLREKKITNSLDNASSQDFSSFLLEQYKHLNNGNRQVILGYGIDTKEAYDDFVMVFSIILQNLNDKLSEEDIFRYQKQRKMRGSEKDTILSNNDRNILLYIINSLSYNNSLEDIHRIIEKYIETGNICYFTRKDNVRALVFQNFTPFKMKALISEMGYRALIDASYDTYMKYGYGQMVGAISKYFNEGNLTGFTNDNDSRSYLNFITSREMLITGIKDRICPNKNISMEELGKIVVPMIIQEVNDLTIKEKGVKK